MLCIRYIWGVFFGILFLFGCKQPYVSRRQYDRDIQALQKANEQLKRRNLELEARLASVEHSITASEAYAALMEELKRMLAPYGAEVTPIPGGVRIGEPLLFDLGRAEVKEKGKEVLRTIAKQYKDTKHILKIVGHTDNVPIKEAYKRYGITTNLELGLLRAKNVMLQMKKAGLPETRMLIESHGQNSPILPNDTPQNRQKNRRVEIFVLEEG
jgi:flagellar motor protein MotB